MDQWKKAKCGWNKCFFRHLNGIDGFLVGLTRHKEDMTRGYERGIMLEARYGPGHYYYREHPPERIRVPRTMHELGQSMYEAAREERKLYRYITHQAAQCD